MALIAGSRLGPYEILSPLGAGGMGEVYRARDGRLGRDVAIKVLPESVAGDAERLARFQREARSLAAVNHPSIVTIFSVEEAAGTQLLVMELVEGRTLDLAIPSGGLSLSRFFDIAVPIADALSAAHQRGIVHRDLKPANVMITGEGRVKVLDFGLAKIEAAGADSNATDMPTESRAALTGEGTVFGTVAYMSPEQARGGKIDARSDVFSLGIVLYEMLTGERPFTGQSSMDLISSILRDRPASVTEIRADLPAHVGRILRRCLEKEPRDRYQTSRDVFNELRDLQAEVSSAASSRKSPPVTPRPPARADSGSVRAEEGFRVAVHAFKSSGGAEMESLAEGLGEEITTGLSRFRYLSVVAGAAAAADTETGARFALEGSIRKGGSSVRVSAQLVDVETGARLWAETYNRDLPGSDIFAIQDDVAARIVATVADSYGVLVHSIRAAMRQKDDSALTPLEWQFQYFAYREQITPASHESLEARLKRAVERDERQSDLWACLAQIYLDQYAFGFRNDATSLDRALVAARRAVELDRANQFALVALAQVHFFRQDLAAFGPAAERAMALNPLNTDAVGILGLQIVHTGEFERGTAIVRRAMELNPNHAGWMHFAPLWNHFHKGEYEQALACANRVDVPGLFWPYLVMASACGHLGRRAEAEAAVRDLLALDSTFASHARRDIAVWHFASGLLEPIVEGVRKAGLAIAAAGEPSGPQARSAAEPVTPSLSEKPSILVLPFKDVAGATDQDHFTDGMVVEIVAALSKFQTLFVVASASSLSYKGDARSPDQIARELGVRYVLLGSTRKAGDRVRIAVELLADRSPTPIWTERFDGTLEDVFALQDTVANAVASQIEPSIQAAEVRRARARPTQDQGAYDLYLRGLHSQWGAWGRETLLKSIDLFEQAIARDPDFALALAHASNAHVNLYVHDQTPDPEGARRAALDLAKRAVRADGDDPEVLGFAAYSHLQCGSDLATVDALIDRSLALNPGSSVGRYNSGWISVFAGRPEAALAEFEMGLRLDPRSPWRAALVAGKAFALFHLRRFAEALPHLYAVLELETVHGLTSRMIAACHAHLGRLEEARRVPGGLAPASHAEVRLMSLYRNGEVQALVESGVALAAAGEGKGS